MQYQQCHLKVLGNNFFFTLEIAKLDWISLSKKRMLGCYFKSKFASAWYTDIQFG